MTISGENHNNTHDDVTQGENPGAQGDFGAGQGDPGLTDPVVGDGDVVEGDEQPRRDHDSGADDVESDSGI